MMKTKTHKMLDLAIQILQAASEEEAVPETSQLKGPTPEQRWRPRTVAGYVVRYAGGGSCGSCKSQPLSYAVHFSDDLVLIEESGIGTIFPTLDAAGSAITVAVKYQREHELKWNEYYGHYLIDPVYA